MAVQRDAGPDHPLCIAGGLSTVVYSAVYLPLTAWVLPHDKAVLAVPPAFLVAVIVGFFLHSAWSFRGHGTRDSSGRQHLKFLVVQVSAWRSMHCSPGS